MATLWSVNDITFPFTLTDTDFDSQHRFSNIIQKCSYYAETTDLESRHPANTRTVVAGGRLSKSVAETDRKTEPRWVLYPFYQHRSQCRRNRQVHRSEGAKDSSYKYTTSLHVPKAQVSQAQYPNIDSHVPTGSRQ